MNNVLRQSDLEIIRRYLDQPDRPPTELRAQIEAAWNGARRFPWAAHTP